MDPARPAPPDGGVVRAVLAGRIDVAFDLAVYLLVMDTSTRGGEHPADIRLVRFRHPSDNDAPPRIALLRFRLEVGVLCLLPVELGPRWRSSPPRPTPSTCSASSAVNTVRPSESSPLT